MNLPLLPTTLVGSYPQPDWLIDREALAGRLPPRVRASDLWRVDPERLKEAQDDATLLAIRDQERAGLDIVTDGEIRRETTPTASRWRLTASTPTTPARCPTGSATRCRSRASPGRSAAASRFRCRTSGSCARTPTAR